MLNQDYRDMLSLLSDNDVRFLIVRAYVAQKARNLRKKVGTD